MATAAAACIVPAGSSPKASASASACRGSRTCCAGTSCASDGLVSHELQGVDVHVHSIMNIESASTPSSPAAAAAACSARSAWAADRNAPNQVKSGNRCPVPAASEKACCAADMAVIVTVFTFIPSPVIVRGTVMAGNELINVIVLDGAIALQSIVSPDAAFRIQKGRVPVWVVVLPIVGSSTLVFTLQVTASIEPVKAAIVRKRSQKIRIG